MKVLETRRVGEVIVIRLDAPGARDGGLVAADRDRLDAEVAAVDRPRVVVALDAMEYLTSTGISVLVGLKRRAEAAGGRLLLVGARAHVMELMRVTHLDRVFEFAATEAEAITRLGGPEAS